MLIILILVFGFLTLIDMPELIQKKYWRELTVYGGLMLTAFILSALLVLGVPLPAVSTGITELIQTVFHMK